MKDKRMWYASHNLELMLNVAKSRLHKFECFIEVREHIMHHNLHKR